MEWTSVLVRYLIADLKSITTAVLEDTGGCLFTFLVSITHKGKNKVVLDHQSTKHRLENALRQLHMYLKPS